MKGEGTPKYLRKKWRESRWRRITRFRLENEMRKSRHWEEEEKKRYRLCRESEKTWRHVWKKYREWKSGEGGWQMAVRWVLGEEGEDGKMNEGVGRRKEGSRGVEP